MNSLFHMSLVNKTPIMMYYLSRKNEISQRIVTVIDFGKNYIKVYCHWRKQYRTFKRENILSVGKICKKGHSPFVLRIYDLVSLGAGIY